MNRFLQTKYRHIVRLSMRSPTRPADEPTVCGLNPESEWNEYPVVTQTLHSMRRTRAPRHAEVVCRAQTSCSRSTRWESFLHTRSTGNTYISNRNPYACIAFDLGSDVEGGRVFTDIVATGELLSHVSSTRTAQHEGLRRGDYPPDQTMLSHFSDAV